MKRTIAVLVAVLAVSIGLISPASAATPLGRPAHASPAATPPPDPSPYLTVAQVLAYATTKSVGPSAYTGYGKETITGFYKNAAGNYHAHLSAVTKVNPTTPLVVSPDLTWSNPFSWDWGHILGEAWDAIWQHCLKGAATGIVGRAAGALIANLIARGGAVFVGPWGYAAIGIGGCLVQAIK